MDIATIITSIINTFFVNIKSIPKEAYMAILMTIIASLVILRYFNYSFTNNFFESSLIFIGILALCGLTYHIILFVEKYTRLLFDSFKSIKEKAETKKKYLQARYSYYDKLWNSFFSDIEKKFFIELVKKHTNFGIMPIMREPFQIEDLYKNKLIIKNYFFHDFVVEEFDPLFLKWVKETQKI